MNNEYPLYQDLCALYFDLDKPTVSPDAYEFFYEYAKKSPGPILEPMCGTGRFLIPLFQAGFNIQGFDASAAMLELLYQKCAHKNLKPQVQQLFLQDFKSDDRFGLIFIPDGSLSLITDLHEISHCLKILYDHVMPGGTLVIELIMKSSPPYKPGLWTGNFYSINDDTYLINNSLTQEAVNDIGTAIGKYELVYKNEIIKTQIEKYELRLFDFAATNELLRAIGFSNIRHLKVYDYTVNANPNDELIIFECTK